MRGTIITGSLLGVDAVRVDVEVDLLRRLPSVSIIGLPALSVRESGDRVRSALVASGFEFPRARVVISMAPADLPKEGTAYDLAVALGILVASGRVDVLAVQDLLFVGELSLGGELRRVRGALAYACLARDLGLRGVVLPRDCRAEASVVAGISVFAASSLTEVVSILRGESVPSALPEPARCIVPPCPDLRDVRGQPVARVALEVAAAGGHNLLFMGPPGCGKTMLAARLPGILPPLTDREALECTRVHSVANYGSDGIGLMTVRPFRAPHHTVSIAGLIGNARLHPGEVSLAHRGVLFLDEFPEFPRHAREALRAPLEDRQIVLTRAIGRVVLPSAFTLIAAANPCPCGNLGHPIRPCICTMSARERYAARISGPILDRIDLQVALQPVGGAVLFGAVEGEPSGAVRDRVVRARAIQEARYAGRITCNAELDSERIRSQVDLTPGVATALQGYLDRTGVSARGGARLLKVARTVADLASAPRVELGHLERAVALRFEIDRLESA